MSIIQNLVGHSCSCMQALDQPCIDIFFICLEGQLFYVMQFCTFTEMQMIYYEFFFARVYEVIICMPH